MRCCTRLSKTRYLPDRDGEENVNTHSQILLRPWRQKMIEQRREQRRKQTAEIFTPESLISDILQHLPVEVWEEGKTYCDPACGDGNMLVMVLQTKLDLGHDPTEALNTVYGCDIMRDDCRVCRSRLLEVISTRVQVTEEHKRITRKQIKWLSLDKYPRGSLDYDFSFAQLPYGDKNKRT